MNRTLCCLTLLIMSASTLTYTVAAPPLYAPGYFPSDGVVTPPPVQIVPELSPAPEYAPEPGETLYLPDPQDYQPLVPYQENVLYGPPMPALYPNVIYKDQHRKHPQAIPYVVEVPLWKPILRRRRANYCGPECATITICVPPCNEPCVRVRRFGHKLRYDFGKYEVDVVVHRNGRIVVDYDA